ncbi:unnamed protein product [Calypogeia fissa]
MFGSEIPLPTQARQQQAPLFHTLPPLAAGHASSREDHHAEEGTPYHPDPLPPSPVVEEATPVEVAAAVAAAAATEGLASSPSSRDETMSHNSEPPTPLVGPPPHSMSTALALSVLANPTSPDLKTTENGLSFGGTTGEALDAEAEDDKKREREHKKRSKNWTRPETLKLIRLRTELEPRFAKSGRKTELWDEIADALQRERITRDAQQCRDKWEKLTAGYKEVRDGVKDREDNPFYDELHPLLSGKSLKRERERERDKDATTQVGGVGKEHSSKDLAVDGLARDVDKELLHRGGAAARGTPTYKDEDGDFDGDMEGGEARAPSRKKKRGPKYITVTDLAAVQSLLEAVITRQQRFFRDLLDSMERKEQLREQIRQEKEDKWRAEERAQRGIFNNAMIVLTQKLVGDRVGSAVLGSVGPLGVGSPEGLQGPKRRSKNWKRAEVLQLIKLRGEMDSRFAKSTRRAALWEELAELLAAQGIKRDGKQCREKWDKLMAEYKDVTDGKRDQSESPYFAELTAIVGRPAEAA